MKEFKTVILFFVCWILSFAGALLITFLALFFTNGFDFTAAVSVARSLKGFVALYSIITLLSSFWVAKNYYDPDNPEYPE